MACSIQITEVFGQESTPGQGITTLTIKGIATDCSEVCVSVHQTQPIDHTTPQKTATVNANGNWSIDFTQTTGDFPLGTFLCGRGNKYSINAFCCLDPNCVAPKWPTNDFIDCGGCPRVNIRLPRLRASDPCNPDNTRTVDISATVTPSTVTPVVVSFEIESVGGGPVTFGPAESVSTNSQVPSSGPWSLSLASGSYTVRVKILNPATCPPIEVQLDVPQCQNTQQCPQVIWSASIPGDCNQNGTRNVRVTASITAASNVSYSAQLRDPQGIVVASGSAQAGVLVLTSPPQQLLPGDYVYEVVFTSIPAGCADRDTNTFTIPPCPGNPPPPPPPPPPPDNGDRTRDVAIDLCLLFRLFFLIGLGFLALGAAMFLCPAFSWFDPGVNAIVAGVIATIGTILFLIFFLLWLFICKPSQCDWLLVLWQTLVLIGAVFTYTAFCPECIYLGFGVIGIVAGFGVYIWWVFACKPTLCRTYLELLLFVLFVVDVVSIVEIILGKCVLTSNWWYALIWAAALLALKGLAINGLRRNQCNVTFGG